MKILWITNSLAFPEICKALNIQEPQLGGWMKSMLQSLLEQFPDLEFGIATMYNKTKKIIRKEIAGITYYCLPGKPQIKYNKSLETLWKEIKDDYKPDIVHIHGTEFSHGLAYIKACGANNVIISLQGVVSGIERYYFGGIPIEVLRKHKHLIDYINDSTTQRIRDIKIRSKLEKEYFTLCPNIIGRTEWDQTHVWSINPKAKYYFCNENLRNSFYLNSKWSYEKCQKHTIFISQSASPLKGIHKILQALPLVLREYPDTQIYIAGNNFLERQSFIQKLISRPFANYINCLISQLNIRDKIHFTGYLNENKMVEQYLKANVFVCPSSIENSPNSLGEAQLIGTPCIASYAGGIPDMIEHKYSGFIYRFEEHELLAKYICNLFASPELCSKISLNAKDKALKRHDRIINAKTMYNIYNIINKSITNE